MTTAQLVLDYLKVLLTPQIVAGAAVFVFLLWFRDDIKALFRRVSHIKFPGGAELSTSQSAKLEESDKPPPTPPSSTDVTLPPSLNQLNQEEINAVRDLFNAERARAYVWEYRYLNYFLAPHTQQVLDWFASLSQRTSIQLFDTVWMPSIPNEQERRAVLSALQNHHLIATHNDLIEVTPKGREYIQWRGPLPSPTYAAPEVNA
jgi:hypothetical protein